MTKTSISDSTATTLEVGTTDSIKPGKMKRVTAPGYSLLVCNVDGEFYTVDDMCTHEDASLYLGCLKGNEVECSLHGGRFNVITGEATAEPAELGLTTYRTYILDNKIIVELP